MSKPGRRPSRAEIKEQRSHKRQQERALREQQRRDGLLPRTPPPLPNTCSTYASIAEEQQARFHMEAMALLEAAKPFVGRCNSIGGQQLSKTITEFIAKHRRKMP